MVRAIGIRRVLLLLLGFGVSVFSTLGCTSVFYYPRVANTKFYDPAKFNLFPKDVEITNSEGQGVHGWWFAAATQPAKGTIIFFHGNAENVTTHFLTLAWMPEEGYNYLVWDYPGYGVSQGEPSPRANVDSATAILRWAHQNMDDRPLIIYGQSLGGNIALRAALDLKDQIPFKAVIVDGTFRSYRSIARQKASESWVTWLLQPVAWLIMSDAYAPEHLERLAPVPLLVIHGQQDPVVAPRFGDEIFSLAVQPKQQWKIAEGLHNDTFWRHDKVYRKKLVEYLGSLR
jgi:fermentation-respiration switch protein FrsA (DUF1100 family)